MAQMSLFDDISRPGKESDNAIAKKANKKATKSATVKGSGLSAKIEAIRANVEKYLGKYRDEYMTIMDMDTLHDYVNHCVACQLLSIDTETTGLDPMLDKIVGICLYTENMKPAYLPLRHRSYITGELIKGQLTVEEIKPEFERLTALDEVDMFNAPFDTRFMYHDVGVRLHCTWDAFLGARLMNENEPSNQLKPLHQKYCLDGQEDEFTFSELFKGVPFYMIPIDIATLYGAHDAVVTYELKKFQEPYLTYHADEEFSSRNGMNGVAWNFEHIEMPCIDAIIEMEDNGILLDTEYANKLSVEYHKKLDESLSKVYSLMDEYSDLIDSYRAQYGKLDDPINIGSSKQLAILFYDLLKYEPVHKQPVRGTGEPVLKHWDTELTRAILEYKKITKLLSTYIDKLPECINPNDGRIHCKFNQYGADTGRMSSSDPNMQNIPSHNKDIRKMFVASPGYVLMSSDFSQQEPKCLAALCRKDGDPQMYDTFMQGKDLYSEIASKAFNETYEECLEHFPKGTYIKQKGNKWYYSTDADYDKIADGEDTYADGKNRRAQAKSILLGVLYGRGTESIAEQLNCSPEKAEQIKNSVFKGFPAIKKFEDDSLDFAYYNGYVTTVCGRKRRLPDLMLDDYEFKWQNGPKNDDVLDFDGEVDDEVPIELQNKYLRMIRTARRKSDVFKKANEKDGIWVVDNTKKIADASRQCVNSRIQGSAADLTKLAVIDLIHNKELKDLGFRLLVPVHDEVIAECPEENVKECVRLLAETMSGAAEKVLEMPIKCDVVVTREWYGKKIEI